MRALSASFVELISLLVIASSRSVTRPRSFGSVSDLEILPKSDNASSHRRAGLRLLLDVICAAANYAGLRVYRLNPYESRSILSICAWTADASSFGVIARSEQHPIERGGNALLLPGARSCMPPMDLGRTRLRPIPQAPDPDLHDYG